MEKDSGFRALGVWLFSLGVLLEIGFRAVGLGFRVASGLYRVRGLAELRVRESNSHPPLHCEQSVRVPRPSGISFD